LPQSINSKSTEAEVIFLQRQHNAKQAKINQTIVQNCIFINCFSF